MNILKMHPKRCQLFEKKNQFVTLENKQQGQSPFYPTLATGLHLTSRPAAARWVWWRECRTRGYDLSRHQCTTLLQMKLRPITHNADFRVFTSLYSTYLGCNFFATKVSLVNMMEKCEKRIVVYNCPKVC